MNKLPLYFLLAIFSQIASVASACDLCAIYSSLDSVQPSPNTFHLGLAEQFTSYSKLQENGQYREDPAHQHVESSIAQIFGSYDLTEKFGLQLNLPYINRRYRRYESGEIDSGTEAGIGDLTLIAKYRPLDIRDDNHIYTLQFFGGLKFATGDTDMLKEHRHSDDHEPESDPNIDEEDSEHEEHQGGHDHETDRDMRHAGHDHESSEAVSAIHGHDLALGSGSYDFPIGFNVFVEYGRAFLTSSLQYTFRTEGDYDYEYGDDLLWDFGPGYYLVLCYEQSLAMKVNMSGEYKRKDKAGTETDNDTGINALFVGPELIYRAGDNWTADLAWDLPVNIENSGLQTVADYRLRLALNYRF